MTIWLFSMAVLAVADDVLAVFDDVLAVFDNVLAVLSVVVVVVVGVVVVVVVPLRLWHPLVDCGLRPFLSVVSLYSA